MSRPTLKLTQNPDAAPPPDAVASGEQEFAEVAGLLSQLARADAQDLSPAAVASAAARAAEAARLAPLAMPQRRTVRPAALWRAAAALLLLGSLAAALLSRSAAPSPIPGPGPSAVARLDDDTLKQILQEAVTDWVAMSSLDDDGLSDQIDALAGQTSGLASWQVLSDVDAAAGEGAL